MHPHRGIETVTYMLEGSVHHRDSLGNSGLIGFRRRAVDDLGKRYHARGDAPQEPARKHFRFPVVGKPSRSLEDEPAALSGSQRWIDPPW